MNDVVKDVVDQVRANTLIQETKIEVTPKKDYTYVLIGVVCFISIIMCSVIAYKARHSKAEHVKVSSLSFDQIKPIFDSTNERIDDLTKRIDLLSNRQWLLGLAHNENTTINSAIGSRTDPELVKKYMILNEDWKLNKAPEFLKMSDEDRKRLADSVL